MEKYAYKATNLIAEAFEEQGVKFYVVTRPDHEQILAGFSVECGPNIIIRFITTDGRNDVRVRVFGLVNSTPKSKRLRLLEACNTLNNNVRFIKFTLNDDGDISVEYDFSRETPDDALGAVALDMLGTVAQAVSFEYQTFMQALYSEEDLAAQGPSLIQRLQELRDMMGNDDDGDEEDDDLEVFDASDDTTPA